MFQRQLQWRSTCWNDNLPDPAVQIRYEKTPVGFNECKKTPPVTVCTVLVVDEMFVLA